MINDSAQPAVSGAGADGDGLIGLTGQATELAGRAAPDSDSGGAARPAAPAGPSGIDASVLAACPYLGVAEDSASHYMVPEEIHHCFGLARHARVPRAYQAEKCLTETYAACPVFEAAQAGGHGAAPWPVERRRKSDGLLSRLFGRR